MWRHRQQQESRQRFSAIVLGPSLPHLVARENFFHPASQSLFKKLEQLSQRSGVSRGVAFEDWLTAMVCALAAETKEGEYLGIIARHKAGKQGHRGADLMGQMFGELVNAMRKTREQHPYKHDLSQSFGRGYFGGRTGVVGASTLEKTTNPQILRRRTMRTSKDDRAPPHARRMPNRGSP